MSTFALTGGSGFIGGHVARELVRRGHRVVLLLREQSKSPADIGPESIVRSNFLDDGREAFERAGRPDALIHLAWGGLPAYRSRHHLDTELPAHARFLSQMVRSGLRHLLVAGTCFEYGMREGALHEDMTPNPANFYAEAKDALRQRLTHLQSEVRYSLTWARVFYTWGDGQASSSLWSMLSAAVARHDRDFPMTTGEQLRDYLPVEDVARLVVTLASQGRNHGIVNVCSGRPVSVRSLVETWIRDHGWSIEPAFGRVPYADHEPAAFWGDATKLHACAA